MENNHQHSHQHTTSKNWYDRNYKLLLIIPAVLLIISLIYIISFHQKNGDFIHKDVSLTGGTTLTIFDSKIDAKSTYDVLKSDFPDLNYRVISDLRTGKQKGFSLETSAESDKLTSKVESVIGYELTTDNSSVEFSGASLSSDFYNQLLLSIIAAFTLMSWVVFIIFSPSKKIKLYSTILTSFAVAIFLNNISWLKYLAVITIIISSIIGLFLTASKAKDKISFLIFLIILPILITLLPVSWLAIIAGIALVVLYIYNSIPSFAVIFCAFADILMTLAAVDLLGMTLSTAGIIAFLMLIGYSVDTDILLTSKLIKQREGQVNQRLNQAFKTGITMTLTAIASIGVAFILVYTFSETLKQIFGIILIGLLFDIINTWITNASLLKWFMEVKNIK